MPSNSEPLPRNSIRRIPNAVLREIFAHCLPRDPLKVQQPNTTIAPLLLCHVCSSWRTVALASATLWSHLSYCLTISDDDDKTDLIKSEVEFIQWWRNNQGSKVAPFLRFSVKPKKRCEITRELSADGMAFVLEYLTLAQYLELEPFYWEKIEERIKAGNSFIFPHLHTLAKSEWDEDDYFYQVQGLLQTHTTSALRRLSISNDILHPETNIQLPILWSTLTHLSLQDITISLDFWFSFICAVPNLEWGYIDIAELSDFEDYSKPSSVFSLPQLSTFCVAFRDTQEDAPQFVFSVLFTNLLLPAVRTLSLSWFICDAWYDHDTTTELYTILKSAPAVTTLALAENFLALVDPGSSPVDIAARGRVEPIWTHAPNLVNLQLEVPQEGTRERTKGDVEAVLGVFVRDTLFSEGSWLDLRSPTCPIRTVTIVDHAPPSDDSEPDSDSNDTSGDSESDDMSIGMGNFTMANIRKHADKAPNVIFQLSSKSASHIAAEASNKWGSSICHYPVRML